MHAYDTDGAYQIYQISPSVKVIPDVDKLENIIKQIIWGDPYLVSNIILYEGEFVESVQELQSISALFNEKSLSDKLSILQLKSKFFISKFLSSKLI